MKILSIGNSFSQDAHVYINSIDRNIDCTNLYIPGCSLKQHDANIENSIQTYELQRNGVFNGTMVSLKEGLLSNKWDIITLQQSSAESGIIGSYSPYLENIITYVKTLSPRSEIIFHETWAYDIDSENPSFSIYNCNQTQMFNQINSVYAGLSDRFGFRIIPVGEIIQECRTLDVFDSNKKGIPLCRDGYHLSFGYGRYIASAAWVQFLTGKLKDSKFYPKDANNFIIQKIKSIIVEKIRIGEM